MYTNFYHLFQHLCLLLLFSGFCRNLFLHLRVFLCRFQCSLCLCLKTISHSLLFTDFNFLHHGLHHIKLALLFEVKVTVRACCVKWLLHALSNPLLHTVVGHRHVLLYAYNIHKTNHSNSEETGVHPVLVSLCRTGNSCKRRVSFSLQRTRDILLGLSLCPSFQSGGLGINLGLIETNRCNHSSLNFLGNILLRIIFQYKVKDRDQSQTEHRILVETSVDNNEVQTSNKISANSLVEGIYWCAEHIGELCEGLSNSADLGTSKVSVFTSKVGISFSWLVTNLSIKGICNTS
mmetsp:Transcript_23703/g.39101  ORF Transcript_23703/g.39101 Transcript_23703/m.39101 type:complete len:291 (-) Transcript_23703:268-1140(-)